MKKQLAMVLTLMMVFGSCVSVFATTDAANGTMSDIKETKYEEAVTNLVSKGVISGFEDGTFKPEDTFTRAQACIVVTKMLNPTEEQLNTAKDCDFKDLKGYHWAKSSIRFAASKGVVAGYGNGLFKPGEMVSYTELVAMLINAMGYKASDLTGDWPNNYQDKATELGLSNPVTENDLKFDFKAAATRGNVALITNVAFDKIVKIEEEVEPTVPVKPEEDKTPNDKTTGFESTGKLANYSGRAYGMILDMAKVVNKEGESVEQLEFLFGNETSYLNVDTKCNVPDPIDFDGVLYTLKMVNGVVKDIATDGTTLKAKHFAELTSGWETVKNRSDGFVTATPNGSDTNQFTVIDDASFYLATFSDGAIDGYESASLSDIRKGSLIRAYDVIDDSSDLANVVIIIEK